MTQIDVKIEVTDKNIDDILVGAFEGGINYWCDKAEVLDGDYKGAEYASHVISKGGKIKLHVYEDDPVIIDKEKILQGIAKEVNRDPMIIDDGKINDSYYDACNADCIVQYAAFGELVYG